MADDTLDPTAGQPLADPGVPMPAAQASVQPEEDNPFLDRLTKDPSLGRPSLWERMRLDFLESAARGTLAGVGVSALLRSQSEKEAASEAGAVVGSAISGAPVPEATRVARDRYDQLLTDLRRQEMMPSAEGPLENIVALAGTLGGGLVSPESYLMTVPGIGPMVSSIVGRMAGPVVGRIAEAGVSQGLVNVVTDPLVQTGAIGAGTQDRFDPIRTALAFPIGAVLGGAIQGAHELVGALSGRPASAPTSAGSPVEAASRVATEEVRAAIGVTTPEPARSPAEAARQDIAEVARADPSARSADAPPPAAPPLPTEQPAGTVDMGALPEIEVKAGETPPEAGPPPQAAADAAAAVREAAAKPSAVKNADAITATPPTPGKPAGVFMFDPAELKVDPERFQFKSEGDTEGVTPKLRGVTEWDPSKANQVIVWQDRSGDLYVADGHQRTGLARRIGRDSGETIEVPGLLYREADGWSARDVMILAAEKNIGEGSGTLLDAAKVIRAAPQVADRLSGISDYRIRQAGDLARLSDEPWRMVVNEVVTPEQGAIVGRIIRDDPDRQVAAIDAINRFEPRSNEETTALVTRVSNAELARADAKSQGSLFGEEPATSTVMEEVRIVGAALKELRRDKALFQRVLNAADRLEQAGSQIDRSTAGVVRDDAQTIAAYLASRADTPGPIRDALKALAREVKDGTRSYADAAKALVRDVARSVHGDEGARPIPREGDGGTSGGGRQQAPVAEPGAEGRPQLVIPGAERVGPAEQAARRAEQPIRPAAEQNFDTSGLTLFGDGHKQQDLRFLKNQPAQPGQPAAPVAATAQAEAVKTLHEQALALADSLDLPVRGGRVQGGPQARAQYDYRQDVTRAKAIADIEAVSHEAGHAIENRVGQPLRDLIGTHANELGPLDYDPVRLDPLEGFAQWIRHFITAPVQAMREAPQFGPAFRALMADKAPNILDALDRAQAAHAAWENAPTGAKLAAIVKTQEPDGIIKSIKDDGMAPTVSMVLSRSYDALFDNLAPVRRAVRDLARMIRDSSGTLPSLQGADNPENLARLFVRSHQSAVRDMLDGVRPYHQVVPQGPSLRDALVKATHPGLYRRTFGIWDNGKVEEFSNYLVARRAEYLWRRKEAGTLDNRPIAMSKAEVASAMTEMEAANPSFREAGDMVHAYTRELLRKQFEGGLLAREDYERLLQEEFYVPFLRDMRDKPLTADKPTSGASRSEGPGAANLIKRIRGSDRDVINPIQSLMTMNFLINRTIAHNDILKSLVNLAREAQKAGAVGTGRILEEIPAHDIIGRRFDLGEAIQRAARDHGMDPDDTNVLMGAVADVFGDDPIMATFFRREPTGKRGEPILFYKDGGQLRAVRLISKKEGTGLYEALAELPTPMRDVALQIGSTWATLRRGGIVTNPVFALTNYLRDQLDAFVKMRGYVPFNPAGIYREIKQDPVAQMYTYAGGVSPGSGAVALSEMVNQSIDALARKGWLVQKLGGIHDLFRHGDLKAGLKSIGEAVGSAETATRLNIMKQVFEQKKRQGLSDYDAMIEAAAQAQDIMDFGRHGSGTQQIRAMVPFWSAHIQGLDKSRRVLIEPLTRALRGEVVTQQDREAIGNAYHAWFKMAAIGGALGTAYGWWASQHEAYRDANAELRATHLVMPGGAFGYPGKILVVPKPFEMAAGFNIGEALGLAMVSGDSRIASFVRDGLYEVMMPPNLISDIPIVGTYAELKLNRSFFTGRDIVPERMQRLTPGEQAIPGKTSPLAQMIGKELNISPIKIDYGIGSTFGLWGRDILAASNVTDENAPVTALEDQMFFRRFIKGADRASETTKRFWELAGQRNGEYAQANETYLQRLQDFRDADAAAFLAALPAEKRAYVTLQSAADPDTGKMVFSTEERRMHPLTRAATAVQTINALIRELNVNAQKEIETGERVSMDPLKRRQVIDNLRVLAATEQRNALVILGDSGYAGRKLLSPEDQFATIKAIDPRIADEVATRYATNQIRPTEIIAKVWPEAQKRLLQDGGQADLIDLSDDVTASGYAFGGDKVKKAGKRRVPIIRPQPELRVSP